MAATYEPVTIVHAYGKRELTTEFIFSLFRSTNAWPILIIIVQFDVT